MKSQSTLILEALQAANGDWVPMPDLARIGETLNVHTRVDELRHLHGVRIENKLVKDPFRPRRKLSFYRLPI
jgi:hypothetical protein